MLIVNNFFIVSRLNTPSFCLRPFPLPYCYKNFHSIAHFPGQQDCRKCLLGKQAITKSQPSLPWPMPRCDYEFPHFHWSSWVEHYTACAGAWRWQTRRLQGPRLWPQRHGMFLCLSEVVLGVHMVFQGETHCLWQDSAQLLQAVQPDTLNLFPLPPSRQWTLALLQSKGHVSEKDKTVSVQYTLLTLAEDSRLDLLWLLLLLLFFHV